ncbi:hypothetical protein D9619_005916 [Psilocybe cf. subviscida]|uniref:ubiquitinyl hydrolase 1 n=1 Tax=Psilocybe cf. subviscida TaxID=2480587 RepID=A0A8H5BWD9_9AGAR|nr:hypothetical protein D9619_005916 [Psilocybe cf. subviscida]
MPPKRKRTAALPTKGLLPGEQLKRNALSGSSSWAWVGTEVYDVKHITPRHRLLACHLDSQSPCHTNKYAPQQEPKHERTPECTKLAPLNANGELEDDIIIISDDELPTCSKKDCKNNPLCLNYLGQDIWEDEEDSEKRYFDIAKLGTDPSQTSREMDIPVGLKNLGATCYANASLQVWFRDLAFRSGVYSCQPPDGMSEEKYMDSPIFQLQATFAALQEGNQSPFNPKKLVESLQLRTAEQQDAQEFSKLFMSHLDAEFRKQSSLSTQKLIENQFQGSQVYGTICHSCKNRSERSSDFLELEINFEQNSTLEDRIAASLVPETLSGENKYFCSRCESLQDATRYSELRQLPPVLHFSLLRFVYDFDTMERKKLKHSISFPKTLSMNKYVGSKNTRNTNATEVEDNLYELRGILLHKGASAYHGHYEAQVYDAELGSWFQFNDELVTRIDTLGDKSTQRSSKSKKDSAKESSKKVANNTNTRKRRRIEDSDDEIVEIEKPVVALEAQEADTSRLISSKDAYMLIYAKVSTAGSQADDAQKVPARVMKVIRELNTMHDTALSEYKAKLAKTKAQFLALRERLKGIYSTWSTNLREDSVIVSRQALESCLSDESIQADLLRNQTVGGPERGPLEISTSDVVCEHGHLDPTKWKDMKVIPRDAVRYTETAIGCTFRPLLDQSSVCVGCISSMFEEKLYAIEHPKFVEQFENISFCAEEEEGYWISKKWLRDWKTNKPRMHATGQSDPAPDSEEFRDHIYCEHGGLSLSITNRRKISSDATELLKGLFPTWNPLDSETEACAVCDAQVHISKEDKRENRKLVENEKALLKFIYEPSLDSWASGVNHKSFAVIPSHFVKNWKRWLAQPNITAKPVTFDNDVFFCEHHMLIFDPNNPIDMDSSVVLIQQDEWDILQTVYDGGPLICLTRRPHEEGGGYSHDVAVCKECRMKKKSDWITADITIRFLRSNGQKNRGNQDMPVTYAHRGYGARQSKRLRQTKSLEERRKISVNKSTTVKDLKIMANQEFSIPTICQRLFYDGNELDDNSATVQSLQILANDIIDLQEAGESEDIFDSDSETHRSKRRRDEGHGFGGTILGNVDSSLSSSPVPMPPESSPPSMDEKPCLSCTFSNAPDALMCEMCETMFA